MAFGFLNCLDHAWITRALFPRSGVRPIRFVYDVVAVQDRGRFVPAYSHRYNFQITLREWHLTLGEALKHSVSFVCDQLVATLIRRFLQRHQKLFGLR